MDDYRDYKPEYLELLRDTFESYEQYVKNGGTGTRDFLIGEFERQNVFPSTTEIVQTVDEIEKTFDEIDSNFAQIQEYKKQGKSTSKWIEHKLGGIIKKYNIQQTDELTKTVISSINKANNDIWAVTCGDNSCPSTTLPQNYSFEDLNKRAISASIHSLTQTNTLLSTTVIGEAIAEQPSNNSIVIEPLKRYIECDLDSPYDTVVKKTVTTATITATKKGYIHSIKNTSVTEISAIVDRSLTVAKVGYKVANNKMPIMDAVDRIIDRTAAAASTVITRTCEEVGGFVGETVGQALGSFLGSAGTYVGGVVGRAVGEVAGNKVGQVISKGVSKVAEKAKEVCRNVGAAISNGWNKLKNGVKSLFGW